MITKSTAFVTSDNKVFLTRDEAARHELELLVAAVLPANAPMAEMLQALVDRRAEVAAILSTRKPRTPKPPKPSKKKTAANTAQPPTA